MSKVLDKNYYPVPFEGGSSLVKTETSGANTLETHEFYNADGKVVFYWKLLKNADGDVIGFRCKVPSKPAAASVTYKGYDTLA
jgi:hypothetical protein